MPTTAEKLTTIVKDVAGVDLPVRIRAWDGSEAGPTDAPTVVVRNRRALRRLLFAPGEMGLARAYVTGDLDVVGTDGVNSGQVLEDGFRRVWALARTQDVRKPTAGAVARAARSALRLGVVGRPPKRPASEAVLSGRLHTRGRDRAAISHHYDLSNDFYRLILDPKMAYSCAYYPDPAGSEATDGTGSSSYGVADAQRDKLDLVCRKLGLQPGMRLLDIGCGWGSMILHAAEHYGVTAVGVTLSAQQRDEIEKRIAEKGLADKVTVRLQHYREFADDPTFEQGSFDAVSSLEMGEHVGEEHYPDYTQMMFDALKPGGRLLLQQMSRHAGTAPGGGAFIESYIAPDMHMRPLPQTLGFVEGAGFEIRDVEAMREHYVRTVRDWIATFETNRDAAIRLVGEEVYRVWQLYLVGGAMAFDENRMGVDQMLAVKPDRSGGASMPGRRPWVL
ncbi:class I SAM-dependent methyltransferase [Jatrophihabitans sp. YIM 134969]